jgi:hypothetical protein
LSKILSILDEVFRIKSTLSAQTVKIEVGPAAETRVLIRPGPKVEAALGY